jgi:hypothetical protein
MGRSEHDGYLYEYITERIKIVVTYSKYVHDFWWKQNLDLSLLGPLACFDFEVTHEAFYPFYISEDMLESILTRLLPSIYTEHTRRGKRAYMS